MKHSSDEIYVNGDYLKNNPQWDMQDAPWKAAIIASLIKKNNIDSTTVIEIGCGSGRVLYELNKCVKGIQQLSGYDISPQAIALADQVQSENLKFFQEDILVTQPEVSDLLLVIDVLEHIDDFYGFLRNIKARGRNFVFHIPLDLSSRTIMKPHVLFQQRQSVGHIHYFSKEMILWALQDTGFEVIDWVYTKPVVDIDRPDSFKRAIKKMLRNISFSLAKDWSVKKWGGYSMMILAK